jgi:hypothetical protein
LNHSPNSIATEPGGADLCTHYPRSVTGNSLKDKRNKAVESFSESLFFV